MKNSNATNQNDFSLVSDFLGYRSKEDVTNMPPGYLVKGSQNVLTTTASRIGIRKGYTLDGQSNSTISGITSSFDWERHTGDVRHLRAGNSKHQYRYVAAAGDYYNGTTFTAGQVYWIDLQTGLTSTSINYTDFWDFNVELKSLALWVDGSSNVYSWGGGVTTLSSASNAAGVISAIVAAPTAGGAGYTAGDILTITTGGGNATVRVDTVAVGVVTAVSIVFPGTGYAAAAGQATSGGTGIGCTVEVTSVVTGYIKKTGVKTWAEDGFLTNGTRSVSINGTSYAYTGGEATTTLIGITGNPTAEPANSVIHQDVRITANSSITGLPATFANTLISNLKNQIYIGATKNQSVYISKVNSYLDFSFTAPVRIVGEGAILTLDGVPTALYPQEEQMYISAGLGQWYQTKFTLSSDNAKEALEIQRLKTGPLQAAKSQKLLFKVKNSVMFINNEPSMDELGRVTNILVTPQQTNISDPIKVDFDSYDFTDASAIYHKYFAYITIPKENLVRIFNFAKNFWEAPQILSLASFSIIDGELYGHDYNVPQTYKLFDGTNDHGNAIDARAIFSYQNFGTRSQTKYFNEFFIEGYISSNSTINLGIRYEIDGCGSTTAYTINGNDAQVVCLRSSSGSLGKEPLGFLPLGGAGLSSDPTLPPKFRVVKTFPRNDFFETQVSISSNGKDYSWELLAFGPRVTRTFYGNNDIMQ